MSKKPVVLYGASGYTGRLVAEYLREYQIPFIAAGRNREKIEEAMAAVPGIETADYEIAVVDHTVGALTDLFCGAKVVCNTVGPFMYFGREVIEASLAAGVHYIDTGGELPVITMVKEEFGEAFAAKGLVAAPSVSYMYSVLEIAAQKVLEVEGIDSLNCLTCPTLVPTYGSFQTIFAMFGVADQSFRLENNERMIWPAAKGYEVDHPDHNDTLLAHPWGGGTLPFYFEHDTRVRNCQQLTATTNRAMMEMVIQMQDDYEKEIKHLPEAQQQERLKASGESMQPGMPPRENRLVHRCIDTVKGHGTFASAECTIRTSCGYLTTGALQAAVANMLIGGRNKTTGFTSACGAVGHNELFAELKTFGLVEAQMSS